MERGMGGGSEGEMGVWREVWGEGVRERWSMERGMGGGSEGEME